MENVLQAAPQAAPPQAGAGQEPAGGQPPQMNGDPAVAPNQTPEVNPQAEPEAAPAVPEFQFELPSGSRYRTQEDLIRGATEKDFAIERFKARIAELEARGVPTPQAQQPQVDPQAQMNDRLNALAQEIEMEYLRDPNYQGYDPQAIKAQAQIDARTEYRAEQRARAEFQRMAEEQQQRAQVEQWREFERTTPDLQTPLAKHLWEMSVQSGNPYSSPQALLDAVHAEKYRQSIGQGTTGNVGIQSAMQQTTNRPIFGNPQGTGNSPAGQQVLSPTVQRQIEFAEKQGYSGEALERIKQRAINSQGAFSK